MAESGYVTVSGQAKCLLFNATNKAFIFENDKGKINVRKGRDIKDVKFSFGHMFELVLNKKKGTDVWYANEAKDLTGANPTSSGSSSGNHYDSAGQERGNYRNNISSFITSIHIKTGEFPTENQLKTFNEAIKISEKDMLAKKEPIIAEGSGVVEESPEESLHHLSERSSGEFHRTHHSGEIPSHQGCPRPRWRCQSPCRWRCPRRPG